MDWMIRVKFLTEKGISDNFLYNKPTSPKQTSGSCELICKMKHELMDMYAYLPTTHSMYHVQKTHKGSK
jgi:hypothetical protein